MKQYTGIFIGVILAIAFSVFAFTEPTVAPPDGNVAAPINVSGTAQTKAGDLTVNNFYAKNFSVAPGVSEYNITNVNNVTGFNDLFLKGNSLETAPVYIAGSEIHNYTAGIDRLTITNAGNVGIGTAVPVYKLDVNGNARLGQTYFSNSDIYFTNTGHNHTGIGNTAGYAAIENAANYNTLMILGRSGGIGGGRSVSIWDRLDVNGSLYVNGQPTCLQNGTNCPSSTTPNLQAVLVAGNNPTSHIESQGQINTTSYIHAGYNNIQGDTTFYTRIGEIYGWRGMYTGGRGMMLRTESNQPIQLHIGGYAAEYRNAGNFVTLNPEGSGGEARLGAAWGKKGVYSSDNLYLSSEGSVFINDNNQNNWQFDGQFLYGRGKQVFDVNDSYLRLNQVGQFTSGVYTPGRLRVDGDLFQGGEADANRVCRKDGTNCPTSTGLQGGGTVNYVSKFTGSGTIGNSQIFDNGSSIGIGTAVPGAKLHVTGGDVRFDGFTMNFNGVDFRMNGSAWGKADGGRALVHDGGDTLTLNYAGDFSGGVKVGNNIYIANDGVITQNGFTYNFNGVDFRMNGSAWGKGDGGRALVHEAGDTLVINYANDFAGGLRTDSFFSACSQGGYGGCWGDSGAALWGSRGGFGVGVYGSGGNIGVTANGGSKDFYAIGPGQDYASASSIRWKNNIAPIDNPLEKVLDLRGVYFDWNEEHGGRHDVGLIAEEVGKILPEIVIYEKNNSDYASGLDYSRLAPLLIEAIKEQQKQIEELRQEINQFKYGK